MQSSSISTKLALKYFRRRYRGTPEEARRRHGETADAYWLDCLERARNNVYRPRERMEKEATS